MLRAAAALAAVWILGPAVPAGAQPAPGASQAAAGGAGAATAPSELYRIEPRRVDEPLDIDGRLDEPGWQTAAVIDAFIQQEPAEGDPATEQTTVRLLYDASALYIGVEAFDSQPGGVIATEMRRDSPRLFDEDNFQIILDTFQDRRSGYMFVVSPLGAKLEQQVAEEGEGGFRGANSPNINVNWDGVWDASARRTSTGWVAEIAIPMVTLRFPAADTQVWGANFMRNIRRKNEQIFWAPISREYSLTRLSQAGTLSGIRGVNRGMDLRLTPYVLGAGRQDRRAPGNLAASGLGESGLDVKYGVTSGLNLDVTLNTDFAHVEVDEQQVNLTRFPLFFPEKRDFFLENAGMFNVGGGSGFGRTADLFFTRRIGLENGAPIPLIGGARLTGKTGRNNIALMNISTGRIGRYAEDNFFVGRYSRDILARSKVGAILINKDQVGATPSTGARHYNRTLAADATLALHPNFTMLGFVAKTQTPDESLRARTDLAPLAPGAAARDMAGYVRGTWLSPSWHVYSEYVDLQEHFNPEVGFVPRTGIRTSSFHGEWNPRPERWNIRLLDPMWNITYTTDQRNRLLTRRMHQMLGVYFEDGSSTIVWYNDHFEQLDEPFVIHPDIAIAPGAYRFGEWMFMYRSDPSRRLYGRAQYSPQTFFGGTRTDVRLTLGLRATSRISAEAMFSRNDIALPVGAFVADLASLRLDLTLSPRMTFRSLSQYNSTTRSLSNSIRFNWIYSPGSDIYIAYDELRMEDDPRLFDHRFRRPLWVQNRQLAIKMTYLLSL